MSEKTLSEAVEYWRQWSAMRLRDFLPPGFPTIVTLCGSTRFKEAYAAAARAETLAGRIVLSVGLLGHDEGLDMRGPVKAMLDELHLRKIDVSDEVLVLNVGGYIGSSTRREIEYATAHAKAVRYLEATP